MWFLLPIISGLSVALWSAISKVALKKLNVYILTLANTAFSLPFILIILSWSGLGPLNLKFWTATAVCAILCVIALILMMKAFEVSELSLVVPIRSFTPIFLIFTSIPLLGELPKIVGVGGIFFVAAGSYFLQIGEISGALGPFKALFKDRGVQLMLLVSLIYSVTSAVNKIAVQSSNPITYILFVQIMMAMFVLPMILKSKEKFSGVRLQLKWLFLIGFLVTLELFAQMTALQLTLASYVIALKGTSALFGVISGFLFFKERKLKQRLVGAVIMLVGVLLISLS